jgi:hypothetical protein
MTDSLYLLLCLQLILYHWNLTSLVGKAFFDSDFYIVSVQVPHLFEHPVSLCLFGTADPARVQAFFSVMAASRGLAAVMMAACPGSTALFRCSPLMLLFLAVSSSHRGASSSWWSATSCAA